MRATVLPVLLAANLLASPASAEPSWSGLLSTVEIRGTLGFSTGFDSNPEEDSDAEGSAFGRLDGEVHIEVGEDDGTRATIDAEGAVVGYTDSAFDEDYRYEIEAELEQPVGESVDLSAGVERSQDFTDDPTTTTDEIWGQVGVEAPIIKFEVRGTLSEYREDVAREEIEADDLEVFDERNYSGEISAEFANASRIRPVVETRVSAIDYLERRPGKPERDAIEYSALAGFKVEISDDLTVQLGLRRNERFFEAADTSPYSNFGPDLEIDWRPNDDNSIFFWLTRGFEEPSREEGLIRDVVSAGVDWTYRVDERLRLSGGATGSRVEEIEIDYRKTELEAFATARYALRDELDLLLEGFINHEIRHDNPDRNFTRAIVRTGVEASF